MDRFYENHRFTTDLVKCYLHHWNNICSKHIPQDLGIATEVFHQDAAVTLLCILFVGSAVRCVRSLKRWADPASNVTGFTGIWSTVQGNGKRGCKLVLKFCFLHHVCCF